MTHAQLKSLIEQIQERQRNAHNAKVRIESIRPNEMEHLMQAEYFQGAVEALTPVIEILQKQYEKEKP